MEFYNNKDYEKCVTELLNKEFSIENNLYIALSLYHLKRFDVSIKYFSKIKSYFEDVSHSAIPREKEFYLQMYFYSDCLYENKMYDVCKKVCREFIENIPNDMKNLKERSYVLFVQSYQDDLELGYPILKEYINFGLSTDENIFRSYWRKYAEYSEIIDDFNVYFKLYKQYDKDSYNYICLKRNLLDDIKFCKEDNDSKLLLLCAKKEFNKYEEVLIKNKDYVNLALFYENYCYEPEKALTFISMNDNSDSEGIKLFLEKNIKSFLISLKLITIVFIIDKT